MSSLKQPPMSPDDGDGDEQAVQVPEDFQKATHELMKKATTKHHVKHVMDRAFEHKDKLRKADKASSKPEEYSTEGMPS